MRAYIGCWSEGDFLARQIFRSLEKVVLLRCVEVEEDGTRALRLYFRKPKLEVVPKYGWTKYCGDGRWYPKAAL